MRIIGSPSRKALRIALWYALLAGIWIAAGDFLTGLYSGLPADFTLVSLFKGWLFVAVTSILLFFLLRRDFRQLRQAVTETRETQSALRFTEGFLSRLLDNAPTPIYVTAADGRIRLVNKAWCKLLGMESGQVIGHHIDQIFPPESAVQYLENNRQVLAAGASKTMEECVDVAGDRRYYQSVKFPVEDPFKGPMAIAGISIDITERRQMEENLRTYHGRLLSLTTELTLTAERERRQIAGGLHDEIAQPLALARIQLGQLGAEETAEACHQTAREVRKLIEGTIPKIRTLIFELSPPILYELGLEEALRSLAEGFSRQHNLPVEFVDDDGDKPLSWKMKVLLYQAVRELLVNVLKHAGASRAKVVITREGDNVQVVIEDNGAGLQKGWEERSGFGLFSIQERLRYLGGAIGFTTAPGGGTRVVLTVPATTPQEETSPS